jgi:hypothetical protein
MAFRIDRTTSLRDHGLGDPKSTGAIRWSAAQSEVILVKIGLPVRS